MDRSITRPPCEHPDCDQPSDVTIDQTDLCAGHGIVALSSPAIVAMIRAAGKAGRVKTGTAKLENSGIGSSDHLPGRTDGVPSPQLTSPA